MLLLLTITVNDVEDATFILEKVKTLLFHVDILHNVQEIVGPGAFIGRFLEQVVLGLGGHFHSMALGKGQHSGCETDVGRTRFIVLPEGPQRCHGAV